MNEQLSKQKGVAHKISRKSFLKKSGLGVLGLGFSNQLNALSAQVSEKKNNTMMQNHYEIIVIGGSYSGLSAAMTFGRSLRQTLIIDSGKPCNRQTPHSHNFITQDGRKPAEIAGDALRQVLAYNTVQKADGLVVDVQGQDGAFTVRTKSGDTYQAKKLLFATGVKDIMPDIPGFAACWGITAIHCPYCHGYEVRGKNTGILVNHESADEFAKLINHWTPHISIFTNGMARFDKEALKARSVEVVEKPIAKVLHNDGYIKAIKFRDGSTHRLDALYHRPAFEQHCAIPEKLGCELTDNGHLKVTGFQQTNIPGIYASGDCTTFFRSVANAVAQGNIGAALLNHELISEV